ncbi:DUF6541 family protein [Kineococcus sp. SYSU DK004]|uniref:DUF6541 family protein n=1 Tax=Kineococcus sp. SYSU DK004 TaxID=3383125 RepID=UPI003D7E40ED
MTWWQAASPQLLGVVVLLLPGLLVGAALRLRGTALLGAAPLLTVAVLAGAAVAASLGGLRFGPLAAAAGTAAAAVASGLAGLVVTAATRRGPGSEPGGGRGTAAAQRAEERTAAAALAGTAGAAVLAHLSVQRGLGRPDVVSQTFDATFHLNAVRWVLDTGDASPWSVARLTAPQGGGFYPSGWHAVTALVASLGPSPVVAANVVVWVVAGVVWPLGCALLVRAVVGARPLLVASGAVLSQAFVALPWLVDRWGVLWPQALGTTLAAAVLGLAALAAGAGPAGVADRVRAALAAVAGGGGCALVHPGALLLLLPLLALLLLVSALPQALLPWRAAPAQRAVAALAILGAAAAAAGLAVLWPRTASVRAADWPATRSVPQALWESVSLSPAGSGGSAVAAVLVAAGLLVAARRTGLRWLVAAHVLLVALDVLAAAVDAPVSQQLTGFWYNDRFRLAAAVPLTGVPLAVLGARALAVAAARAVRRPVAGRLAAGALAAAVLAAAVPQVRGNGDQLGLTNARAAESPPLSLVDEAEQRFLEDLRRWVPPGDVVAGTPWDGSSSAYALSGVPVLYPHFRGGQPEDWAFLADHLQDAGVDPAVCPALERRDVRWVLDAGELWDPPLLAPAGYTAFRAFQGRPGFEPVAAGGGVTLYRITACR